MQERVNLYSQIEWNKRKSILLVIFFVGFLILLGWVFGQLIGIGYAGTILAVFLSLLLTGVSYYYGDAIVLSTTGAVAAREKDYPFLFNTVEGLSIAAGIPVPKIYVIDSPSINAFATGRDPAHASIAVTTGALSKLERQELEGVVAHELSHVKNFDIRYMAVVAVMVGAVVLLSNWAWRASFFGGRGSDREGKSGYIVVLGLVLMVLAPLFAQLVKFAISRKREYLADADGALLTRNPEGLSRALKKIMRDGSKPVDGASDATAHLFFSNPLRGWHNWFSTHPPLEERIRALDAMA